MENVPVKEAGRRPVRAMRRIYHPLRIKRRPGTRGLPFLFAESSFSRFQQDPIWAS